MSSSQRNEQAQASSVLYRRIVAKVGTNLLTGGTDRLDEAFMRSLAAQIAGLRRQGVQVCLVTSGAIAAGREALGSATTSRGKDIPFKQVLASVGQSRLMRRYEELFQSHGIMVGQALITKSDLDAREGYLNVRNTLLGLLELGVVPIINENDVVDVREIGGVVFGDNDNLSAAVAVVVDADLLAILTDIDGLYTADPRRDPNAKLIARVERIDRQIESLAGGVGTARARGGMITKVQAAKLATASGCNVALANGHAAEALTRLARGESLGTLFPAAISKMDSRRRWMLTGLSAHGRIVVDDGAVRALVEQNRSLLPAGVAAIEGEFGRGDLVDIVDKQGARIGCGLTNYASGELRTIKGAKSSDITRLLGYQFGDEVVHRNDLVLLEPAGAA
jgi:glutamate 5-kinase